MNMITLSSSLRSLAWVLVATFALLPACGGTVDLREASGVTSGGTGDTGGGGSSGSGGAGTGGATSSPASVRFAHLSSQLAPFDVCAGTGDGKALLAAQGLAEGLRFGD